jgi:hypothetical protein
MAGSKRWFQYTLDDGTNVGVLLDESNTEVINGGIANPPPVASAPTRQVPKGTKLRSIFYTSPDGNRVIRCIALTPTIYNGIPANLRTIPDPLGGPAPLTFIRKNPEKVKTPAFAVDTGLNDGDTPN